MSTLRLRITTLEEITKAVQIIAALLDHGVAVDGEITAHTYLDLTVFLPRSKA